MLKWNKKVIKDIESEKCFEIVSDEILWLLNKGYNLLNRHPQNLTKADLTRKSPYILPERKKNWWVSSVHSANN